MAPKIGGNFTWFSIGLDRDNTKVSVPDMNVSISIVRNGNIDDKVSILNNKTTTQQGRKSIKNGASLIRFNSQYELPTLQHILGFDGNVDTFSKQDYDALVAQNGKTVKFDDTNAYSVNVKENGVVEVELREILADKSTRRLYDNNKLIVDFETEQEKLEREKKEYREKQKIENEKRIEKSKKEAYRNGQTFASCVSGLNGRNDFEQSRELIKIIDKDNVIEFLKGYYDKKGAFQNGFFEQIASEWGKRLTNEEVLPVIKALLDCATEEQKNTNRYRKIEKLYNDYSKKEPNEKFSDEHTFWTFAFPLSGDNDKLDNLDERVERLFIKD